MPVLCNEIESLVLLSESRHIIRLCGVVLSPDPYQSSSDIRPAQVIRGVLLNYASRGSLGHVLSTEPDFCQRTSWALQIVYGLREIHQRDILHLDLKAENIVIDEFNNVYITDLAKIHSTYCFRAPELYKSLELKIGSAEALKMADIYPLGVVFWELGTCFEVNIPKEVKDHTDYFALEDHSLPQMYKDLVMKCINSIPTDRPTLQEIVDTLMQLDQRRDSTNTK